MKKDPFDPKTTYVEDQRPTAWQHLLKLLGTAFPNVSNDEIEIEFDVNNEMKRLERERADQERMLANVAKGMYDIKGNHYPDFDAYLRRNGK